MDTNYKSLVVKSFSQNSSLVHDKNASGFLWGSLMWSFKLIFEIKDRLDTKASIKLVPAAISRKI